MKCIAIRQVRFDLGEKGKGTMRRGQGFMLLVEPGKTCPWTKTTALNGQVGCHVGVAIHRMFVFCSFLLKICQGNTLCLLSDQIEYTHDEQSRRKLTLLCSMFPNNVWQFSNNKDVIVSHYCLFSDGR